MPCALRDPKGRVGVLKYFRLSDMAESLHALEEADAGAASEWAQCVSELRSASTAEANLGAFLQASARSFCGVGEETPASLVRVLSVDGAIAEADVNAALRLGMCAKTVEYVKS